MSAAVEQHVTVKGGSEEPMVGDELAGRLWRCAADLVTRARDVQWRGPDPYDGLYWRWPKPLTATRRGRQAVIQLHARAPVDLRVLRRGPRPRIAKTLALFAKAALLLDQASGCERMRDAGRLAAQALHDDRSAGEAWGYPFAVQTRWSHYPANSPNVVVSAFAIDALLLAAERLDEPAYAQRATVAGEWLVARLLTPRGHFAYHEHSDALIHNANLLGAAAVHRTLNDPALVEPALRLTLDAQRDDGSFPYGEGEGLGFCDNFHTAYVLGSLMGLRDVHPDVDAAVRRGAQHWTDRFFDDRGRALLWPDRPYPEDGHSAGTAMTSLARLGEIEAARRPQLRRVCERTLDAMVIGGRTVNRRRRWAHTMVRYLRWCDGHVSHGMACAALALRDRHGAWPSSGEAH